MKLIFVPSKLHIETDYNSVRASLLLGTILLRKTAHIWSSLRSISNNQLHVLLRFHLCPIYLILYKGSYVL